MIYTLTLNPAIDYVINTDTFLMGEINRTKSEHLFIGGKGINVSFVLKEFGINSIALGFTAGFTGKSIVSELKHKGLESDFIQIESGFSRINIKIKDETETDINGSGPKISPNDFQKLLKKLDILNKNDILVIAGSIPKSLSNSVYEQILFTLKDKGIISIVDATNESLLGTLPYSPFLIKPNISELEEIFKRKLCTNEDIIECAKILKEKGALNVLVSLGENGAILVAENNQVYNINAPKGILINSTGAGDSMVAGFITGYIKTKDYKYALKLATATGSATAFSKGLADLNTIECLFNKIDI